MPEHFVHRFAIESSGQRRWVALHDEQMDAVLAGERRVVEAMPRDATGFGEYAWWYFNDSGTGLLRVESGAGGDEATPVWEGRIYDAYVGRLCSVLLL